MASNNEDISDAEKDMYSQLYGIASELVLKDGVGVTDSFGGTLHGTYVGAPFTVLMLTNAFYPSRQVLAVTWNHTSCLYLLDEDMSYTNSDLADWCFENLDELSQVPKL